MIQILTLLVHKISANDWWLMLIDWMIGWFIDSFLVPCWLCFCFWEIYSLSRTTTYVVYDWLFWKNKYIFNAHHSSLQSNKSSWCLFYDVEVPLSNDEHIRRSHIVQCTRFNWTFIEIILPKNISPLSSQQTTDNWRVFERDLLELTSQPQQQQTCSFCKTTLDLLTKSEIWKGKQKFGINI